MAVFCVFFAVFPYSFSASTSYRTAVIERKTYTFHEPSNMLVFLQINNSLLLGAICFLLLSLRGAYHNTLLCQKQNILVYCLAWYLLTASVVVCFTRCVAALAHSCCGMGHWQGCTPTTKATTERFSNFSMSLLAICSLESGVFEEVTQGVKIGGTEVKYSHSEVSLAIVTELNSVQQSVILCANAPSSLNYLGLCLVIVIIAYYTGKMKCCMWKLWPLFNRSKNAGSDIFWSDTKVWSVFSCHKSETKKNFIYVRHNSYFPLFTSGRVKIKLCLENCT